MFVAELATGASGGTGTTPILKVTVLAVAFREIRVMGIPVLAPAHDLELGVEVSENSDFPVPVQGQVDEFMEPYEAGSLVGSMVAFCETGYIFWG